MDPPFVTDAQRAQCAVLFGSCALTQRRDCGFWTDGFSTAETVMTLVTVGLAYWTATWERASSTGAWTITG